MSFRKVDIFFGFLLFICGFLLVFDLFFTQGLPATFDGRMHVTMIAQFFRAMQFGDFPVTWADGFGNYGMPMPLIHQQTIAYLGGIITFITGNAITATHIVYLLGAFLSVLFYYIFLRLYFTPLSAFAGAFLFNFTSYRIFNIYVRGALPEFFASVALPLILISLYFLFYKQKQWAFFLLIFSVALLLLTHPFLLIIYSFIIVPYILLHLFTLNKKLPTLLLLGLGFGVGIGLTSYYLLPLLLETKYLYYGASGNHFSPNQFASLQNYINSQWQYFGIDSIFVRKNFVPFGLLETLLCIGGVLISLSTLKNKKSKTTWLLISFSLSTILLIFFTTKYSEVFYRNISLFSNIQHPWRLFSALLFIPPVVAAFVLDKVENTKKIVGVIVFVSIIALTQFPQLYTKNSTLYPNDHFFFTKDNVAAVVLNPIWTGKSEDYPVKQEQIEIVSGEGTIETKEVKNSTRKYTMNATTPLRVIDYTFYFPGWHVYVDNVSVPIEFQDPKYRGVITYAIPEGKHSVAVKFENTKVRNVGYLLSLAFIGIVGILVVIMKNNKIKQVLFSHAKV